MPKATGRKTKAQHTAKQIAGITPAHIESETPIGFEGTEDSLAEALGTGFHKAQKAAQKMSYKQARESFGLDKRVVNLSLGTRSSAAPRYDFGLTKNLLERLQEYEKDNKELSMDALLTLALKEDRDAVEQHFSAGALNAINASYFGSEVAFHKETGLADLYAFNRPLNHALGRILAQGWDGVGRLRVKELCCGRRIRHWRYILWGTNDMKVPGIDLVLSDFVCPPTRLLRLSRRLRIRAEEYSLLDDMPVLRGDQKFDAMLATYGFDSVWQPEDMQLVHVGHKWYQVLYRVKVADWNPRRQELFQAMRSGQPPPNARPHDFDGIVIEKATEPVDISKHPYGRYIEEYSVGVMDFPGGLIKRVVQAFRNQLKPGGVFVSCDIGVFGIHLPDITSYTGKSGLAGRYKLDNYVVAKAILEKEFGLEVTLLNLNMLMHSTLPTGWQAAATPGEVADITNAASSNGVMIVKHPRRANRLSRE